MWTGSGVSFLCHVEKPALAESQCRAASLSQESREDQPKREQECGEKAKENERFVTGASFFAFDRPLAAVGRLFGSAPATRDFGAVQIGNSVQCIHGILFGGGSVFGLDAVGGLLEFQRQRGIGVSTIAGPIPVCPALGIFDVPALPPGPSSSETRAFALPQFVTSADVSTACAEAVRVQASVPASLPRSDREGDKHREAVEKEGTPALADSPLRVRCRLGSNGTVSTAFSHAWTRLSLRKDADRTPAASTSPGQSTASSGASGSPSLEETASWIGSIGVGVGATCARVGECAGFAPRKGGWGEACRQRPWRGERREGKAGDTERGSAAEAGLETLKVQAFIVVNSYGDIVAAGKGSEGSVVAGPLKDGVTYAAADLLQEAGIHVSLNRDALWRVAAMAGAGMARAIHPIFSPVDGDAVIAVSTGELTHGDTDPTLSEIIVGTMAAECVAEAIQQAAAASNNL
ncbi:putative peptidase family T4 [Neospora caninum Liverpool]|uniref:Putative peptidase family T4 n=1 Tax=Neospora caninum (strain Liverpool) TaxID=572307 RepID=F0VI58_NEOCL|nr:putative peptidase family T4 [Neospora caninum Liverpool]CBZ53419.1 putative peptidase family T4 [Neospora caninum Liverpool]|eukprot:XP_003883451.1 putative peptidase family T4 [Neospora caninum Liverpool]